MAVSSEDLDRELRLLVSKADLATSTVGTIFVELESILKKDLKDQKKEIKTIIKSIMAELMTAEEDEEEEEEEEEEDEEVVPKKSNKKRASASSSERSEEAATSWHISAGLMDLFGVESDEMDFKVAQKLMQEYIKELPKDPSDGRKHISDDKLIKLFGVKRVSLFGVSKHLKKHIKRWVEGPALVEAPPKKKVKASPKEKSKPAGKKAKTKEEDKAPRKPGGFAKTAYKLSPILAKVTGESELARPQVVKKIWEYIKSNELQDENDKRTILCDDNLKKLFGFDTVTAFSMNKYISPHLTKIEE